MASNSVLRERLERLNAIGIALSGETDINALMEHILVAAKSLVHADAGTLYRLQDDQLHFEIVMTDRLGVALGGTTGKAVPLPPVPLYHSDGTPNRNNVVACSVLEGRTINIADAYEAQGYDFSGTRRFDAANSYRSQSFLTVPLKNHEREIIGALQLINALDSKGETREFDAEDQHLVESLASQAAIALTNRALIESLQTLFESFIKLINLAIDDKSPYTGGHCQRVPALTMLLADAAAATTSGPLRDFQLNETERYELQIAGLLHDCGKVTTPVHVVDKATKLQTLYDRIGLIETRFEVLKRDAEIAHLRGELTHEAHVQLLAQYADDLAFLRRCNVGGEFMRDEDLARLHHIAGYRWRTPQGVDEPFLSNDELQNLAIRKGTLTDSERQIINHHIEVTIQMLESLPWPKHLRNVPEYAGGHHERMDGKGYPRGLTREQMSIQARIMGIADVFEALTARDRPYKHGMKLSQAMTIMARMVAEQHIDPDLFEVFLCEKVWLRYAESYLETQQIDAVDEEALRKLAGLA
ncbi:HD family phosphohydrolase [Chitinilyticum piscinae]|uniref:GAF domain-containing protein n=1 Tax=Chitinilyticum piscinae TaxID=2866724 RepID=A0A8J7FGH6_9NEIS|nr:HD family phosphohydrolase [Chitinilyticum piscinae]MBE9608973.1 GAF domain-containing protein [Chitinilyticum piscinae]